MRRVLAMSLDSCLEVGPNGQPVDCGDSGGGMGGFLVFVVLALFIGLAIAVFKVSMARDQARRSGTDVEQATAMTLLTDRVAELDSLREQGAVTPAEYDERRAAILGSL